MIELRWVEHGPNKQLEYKKMEPANGIAGTSYPGSRWSCWRPVPTYSVDEASFEDLAESGGLVEAGQTSRHQKSTNGDDYEALVNELSETKKRVTDMETKALDYEHALNAILSRGDYIGDDEMGIPVHLFDGRYPEYAGMTHYQIARAALLKHQWGDI